MRPGLNAIEATKAFKNGTGRLIREDFPSLIQKGYAALASEQYLIKQTSHGASNNSQLHTIADLSRRLDNYAISPARRQHIQPRDPVNF